MASIMGLGPAGPARTPSRVRSGTAFQVPKSEDVQAEPLAALTGVSMPSLLAMQEAESGAVQDREARQHGEALLEALTALQRASLASVDSAAHGSGELNRLAGLVRSMPRATDPRLATVQRALLVRVAVEQARRRAATAGEKAAASL